MNFLFVHNNFPAQFRFVAERLTADPRHRVAAIGVQGAQGLPGVHMERYYFEDAAHADVHPFARRFDREARRAEQVLYTLIALDNTGFQPDVIVAHSGWGETLPLRAKYPRARIIVYCEYFYQAVGGDVHFDREFPPLGIDGLIQLKAKNAAQLLALTDCDRGLSPTFWQRSTYPREFQSKIAVVHEGVDTRVVRPNPRARFQLSSGHTFAAGDEVLTYVARNLEPMRGYHIFMRALPEIMATRPQLHVIVAGGSGLSYGSESPDKRAWKNVFLDEVKDRIDLRRIHFLGNVRYEDYILILQVSRVHVYLTYPFVLSWSLIEALSAGCLLVGSDTPPLRDAVINGRNGLLVPFFDFERLARTVCDALARPERYYELRRSARETAVGHFERERAIVGQLAQIVP